MINLKKSFYYFLFLFLLLTQVCFARTFYPFTGGLTGGGTGALDKLSVSSLSDGDVAIGGNLSGTDVEYYVLIFNADDTFNWVPTEDDLYIIWKATQTGNIDLSSVGGTKCRYKGLDRYVTGTKNTGTCHKASSGGIIN